MGGGYTPETIPQILGAVSVLLASVNVAGGFVITKRMLDMFKRRVGYVLALPETDTVVRPHGSSGVYLAVRYSSGRVHRWILGSSQHWNVWTRASRVSHQ